jgi:hypothetical protein
MNNVRGRYYGADFMYEPDRDPEALMKEIKASRHWRLMIENSTYGLPSTPSDQPNPFLELLENESQADPTQQPD